MTKRRVQGEGSVYRRKNGRVIGEYLDGLGRQKYVSGKNKNEVKAKVRRRLAEVEAGLVFDDGNMTVGEYLDRWLDNVRDTVKERSWIRHEVDVRVHIKPELGGVKLAKLSALKVQSLYRVKLDSGLSPRSVQLIHATLHKALKQAVRWRVTPRNVAEDVDPPRPVKREIQPLSAEKTREFLAAVKGDPLEALYVLAVTTGMRQGELLGLKWEDVDLEARVLRVRRTVWNGKASAPKTTASRRQIGLGRRAVLALVEHRERAVAGVWVFSSAAGTPLNSHNLNNRSWYPLRHRVGLPETTRFHDLRHTCATLLLGRGVHPKLVQALLGHASIEMTMNTYSHVMPEMGGAAARAMDVALEERPAEGPNLVPLEGSETMIENEDFAAEG